MDQSTVKNLCWNLLLPWLPLGVSSLGDYLLSQLNFNTSLWIRGLIENGTHVALAAVSWMLGAALTAHSMSQLGREALLCGALAGLIDVDHFIAARSLDLKKVHMLPGRPPFHCTTTALALVLGLFGFAATTRNAKLERLVWMLLVAVVTHHLRDAERRGLWLWPWGSTRPVPKWLFVTAITAFPFAVRLSLYATYRQGDLKSVLYAPPLIQV